MKVGFIPDLVDMVIQHNLLGYQKYVADVNGNIDQYDYPAVNTPGNQDAHGAPGTDYDPSHNLKAYGAQNGIHDDAGLGTSCR